MENSFTVKDTQKAKAVAIILMMIHHCFLAPERWEGYSVNFFPLGQDLTVKIGQFGKICVGMFVFLSGYGMLVSLKKTLQKSSGGGR